MQLTSSSSADRWSTKRPHIELHAPARVVAVVCQLAREADARCVKSYLLHVLISYKFRFRGGGHPAVRPTCAFIGTDLLSQSGLLAAGHTDVSSTRPGSASQSLLSLD